MHDKTAGQVQQNHAFITFSSDDEAIALKLERALQHWRPPRDGSVPRERLQVFRDEIELSGTEYYQIVDHQLSNSQKLIVICSANAVSDRDLDQKIARFASENGDDNVIPVIVSDTGKALSFPQLIPSSIAHLAGPGRVVDYSHLDLSKENFDTPDGAEAWSVLLSSIYDIHPSAILHYEQARQARMKQRRKMMLLAVAAMIIGVFAAGFYLQVMQQEREKKGALGLLAETFREKSRLVNQENRRLQALHLICEAASIAPNPLLRKQMLLEMQPLAPAAMLMHTLEHGGSIIGASFNRREDAILTWGDNNRARLWNLASGEPRGKALTHDGWVYGARFTNDESQTITWSSDSTVQVWEAATMTASGRPMNNSAWVYQILLSGDESKLLSLSEDYAARLWDLRTRRQLIPAAQHDGWINGVTFNRDESRFLTWSDDSTAQLWSSSTGERIGKTMRHEGGINMALLSANEHLIVTASSDGSAVLWDGRSARPAGPVLMHKDEIIGARFDKTEERLLTWSRDNTARLWDIGSGRELMQPIRHGGWVFGAVFNEDESQILSWSYDNSARLWEIRSGKPLGPPMKHSTGPANADAGIFGASFNSAGEAILTWGDDNSARLWSARDGRPLGSPLQHDNGKPGTREIKGAAFAHTNDLILTWGTDSTARVWKMRPLPPPDQNLVDLDYPVDLLRLQVMALTGTAFDSLNDGFSNLPPDRWRSIRKEYIQQARDHYRVCQFPEQNLWRQFYPEQAVESRPDA